MKAIFLYSRFTGNSKFFSKLEYIEQELKKKFDEVKFIEGKKFEDLTDACHLAAVSYDYLIFVGGDGTFNAVINALAKEKRKPILGYIPGGTTNDFSHNFGFTRNIKKQLKIILKGVPTYFDIFSVNDMFFCYTLACGVFSEISYMQKRKLKKVFGTLAYYFIAIKDALVPAKCVKGKLFANGQEFDVKTPFFLCLNSNHIGGFYVHLTNNVNDGKCTIFLTKNGLFNGLLHYLFFKMRTQRVKTDEFTFNFEGEPLTWCVDGEGYKLGNVHAKCIHNEMQIIVSKKRYNKINKNN